MPQRDCMSYNESISVAAEAATKSSSGLMIEPPLPDWRRRQERLNWLAAQNFGDVAAAPAQPIEAPGPVRTGIVGRTFREGIGLGAHASMECAGVRLRESPLLWRRRWQIFRSLFLRNK